MTLITRRSVLGAAVLTAAVPVVADHDRAIAADADIDLAGVPCSLRRMTAVTTSA